MLDTEAPEKEAAAQKRVADTVVGDKRQRLIWNCLKCSHQLSVHLHSGTSLQIQYLISSLKICNRMIHLMMLSHDRYNSA